MKCTILLGAGATSPFLPISTNSLTDSLLDKEAWGRLIQEVQSSNDGIHIDIDIVLSYLSQIKCKLKSKGLSPDFERIIHLADTIFPWYAHGHSFASNIDEALVDFSCCSVKHASYVNGGYVNVPFLCREIIARKIIQAWNNNDYSNPISLYKGFFDNIQNKFSGINVYSLNYDPLLSTSLQNSSFENGFDDQGFNSRKFLAGQNALAYLHGHVGFIPTIKKVRFLTEYDKASEERSKNINNIYIEERTSISGESSKGPHYNTFLTTGLDKVSSFLSTPFNAYFYRLGKDLQHSNLIIIIGMSLVNDSHIFLQLSSILDMTNKTLLLVSKGLPDISDTNSSVIELSNRLELSTNTVDLQNAEILMLTKGN